MAGIVSGSIELGGLAQRLTQTPTPIKYLWIQTPIENKGVVFIGGPTVASNNAPVLAKGTPREFTFRHDVKEAPGDLADFYVHFGHNEDVVNYLAITI